MSLRTLPRLWLDQLDGRESADCPAARHRHSLNGYRIDGCRCPSTEAAYRRYMDIRNARRRQQLDQGREIDDCPAERHRHNRRGYHQDGCRCPSTVKAVEAYRDDMRRRQGHHRPQGDHGQPVDLDKADELDAEAIVQGYRLGVRVDKHTRALAVLLMVRTVHRVTDRQMAWRLTNAGQGRWVSHDGQPPVYEPVSMRTIQRIVADLAELPGCEDIRAMNRSGRDDDGDDDDE